MAVAALAPAVPQTAATTYTDPISSGFADTFADPVTIRGQDGHRYAHGTSDPLGGRRRGEFDHLRFHQLTAKDCPATAGRRKFIRRSPRRRSSAPLLSELHSSRDTFRCRS